VLIADDSERSRELLRAFLVHLDYEVVEAVNGTDAVFQAHATIPDAIILDVQMHGLDGYGAVGKLRADARFAGTPILALTAYARDEDRQRALAAGFSGYMAKPVGLAGLREALSRAFEARDIAAR
jgi:CheY-like chemotaxis protein